jgi:hypothetical protein
MSKPENDDNPYFAPAALIPPSSPKTEDRGGWAWALSWTVVFALNLVVPLIFGWDMTEHGGHVGLIVATAMLWVSGFRVGGKTRDRRFVMLSGGTFVALTQFVPFLQIMAGLAGWGLTSLSTSKSPLFTEAQGFLATIITGGLLLVAAIFFGRIAKAIAESAGWRRK